MTLGRFVILSAAVCGLMGGLAHGAAITFNFDTGTPALVPGQSTPLIQTVSGLTAGFTAPTGAFFTATGGTTGFTLSLFSGNFLNPASLTPGDLEITFSQPVTSIAFDFATADLQQVEVPTTVQLSAFDNSTAVGSASGHGTYASDTFPMGTLSFNSGGAPFNLVRIGIAPGQPLGSSDFLVDNISVTTAEVSPAPVPEPATLSLCLAAGLLLGGRLVRRNG